MRGKTKVVDFSNKNLCTFSQDKMVLDASMTKLVLSNNDLIESPELDCPSLDRLDLRNNKIRSLHLSLINLPKLELIHLKDNLIHHSFIVDNKPFQQLCMDSNRIEAMKNSISEWSNAFRNYLVLSILVNRNVKLDVEIEVRRMLKKYDGFLLQKECIKFNFYIRYYCYIFGKKCQDYINFSHFKINDVHLGNTEISDIAKTEVKHLNLSSNQLHGLDDSFKKLKSLRILWLKSNQFNLIPMVLVHMDSLQEVDLSNNPIDTIHPENIKRWSYLKSKGVKVILSEELKFTNTKLDETLSQIGLDSPEIDLSSGNFSAIPESLSFFLENFKNLTRINLSCNDFATLPLITLNEDIKQRVIEIDLSNNKIAILPSSSDIRKYYPKLRILDLSDNVSLEKNVENIFIIQELKCNKVDVKITNSRFIQKRLDFLEKCLKCLKQFQQNTLNVTSLFKELSDVPKAEIFQMLSLVQEKRRPNVEVIILKNNHLDSLSTLKIEQIKTLRELDLSHNAFSSIPSINNTASLQTINLTANPLDKTDPNNISQWFDLTHQGIDVKVDYDPSTCIKLDLSKLSIGTLPETVFKFYTHYNRFDVLDLSNTKISLLPDFFREFNALRVLRLEHNQFTHIPAVLLELSYLEELTLSANPINFQDPENRRIFNELIEKNIKLDIEFPNSPPSNIPVTHKIVITDPQLIDALEAFSEANYGKLILQL